MSMSKAENIDYANVNGDFEDNIISEKNDFKIFK